jgi:hypothetical protein
MGFEKKEKPFIGSEGDFAPFNYKIIGPKILVYWNVVPQIILALSMASLTISLFAIYGKYGRKGPYLFIAILLFYFPIIYLRFKKIIIIDSLNKEIEFKNNFKTEKYRFEELDKMEIIDSYRHRRTIRSFSKHHVYSLCVLTKAGRTINAVESHKDTKLRSLGECIKKQTDFKF